MRLVSTSITLALLGAVAGCTDSGSTIVVLGEDSSNTSALESLSGQFTADTGIHVEFDKATFEATGEKANQDLSRGTGLYDVLLQYNFSLANFVLNDWVLSLDETLAELGDEVDRSFESDIFPNVWREVGFYANPLKPSSEAEAIGYPFAANTMLLVYNRQMFESEEHAAAFQERYGEPLAPPKTWESFRKVAEYFTDPEAGTFGVALQGGTGGWLYYEWTNFAFSMGGGVMDKEWGWEGDAETPLLLQAPETLAATRFYLSLKPFTAGDFFSVGGSEQRELIRGGDVAMGLIWSDYVYDLIDGGKDDRFGFAPVPGSKSILAGGIYYISRTSTAKREAAKYVVDMMSRENQVRLITQGLCSPMRSPYDDPRAQRLPYTRALRESLERGVYFAEAGPDADAVQQTITTGIQRIWSGDWTVEEGHAWIEGEVRRERARIFSEFAKRYAEGG